jgi:hypothetical protein
MSVEEGWCELRSLHAVTELRIERAANFAHAAFADLRDILY